VDVAIVIPARYASRRFPGKPLVEIRGRGMLQRTWAIARAVEKVSGVYVATEDRRVAEYAKSFGAVAIMTSKDCANGTERVREAMRTLERPPDAVVNLQGDAVLTPPWVVQSLVDAFHADPSIRMVTPAVRCTWEQYEEIRAAKAVEPTRGTMVAFDANFDALYFSKAMIPYIRIRNEGPPPVYRHVGIYGYRLDVLEELASLAPTPLEVAEQLEQLRALEHGIPIKVVVVDYRGRTHWSVDTPEDIAVVERLIEQHGELVEAP
jgi:3-deoxy-manno-octulosonate cytidylyltransferase (CMP-KDO synthetase)